MSRILAAFLVVTAILVGSPGKAEDGLGFISEVRGGVYAHDIGLVSNRKERSEWAANGELLFVRPDWGVENRFLNFLLTPRPHVGAYIAPVDNTSYGYAGVTWDWTLFGPVFMEFGFGGVIHNGKLDKSDMRRKALGTRVLFHEQLTIGVEVTEHLRVMATLQHISNAEASKYNSGMDVAGVRVGYKF